MLTIRFNRIGKKNKAFFRLVVQERAIAPGGGHVEILGSYNPHLKKESLKSERIKYWVAKGVNFSDTAYNFLVSRGLIAGSKRAVKMPKKPARNATPARSDQYAELRSAMLAGAASSGEQGVAGGAEVPVATEKSAEAKIEEKKAEVPAEIKKEETRKEEVSKEEVKEEQKPKEAEEKKIEVDPVKSS